MAAKHEYKGHAIEVRTRKIAGKWTWTYYIDREHYKENHEELAPDEATAEEEALSHAKGVIDRF
jgi:hypothetical protein